MFKYYVGWDYINNSTDSEMNTLVIFAVVSFVFFYTLLLNKK